MCGIAGILSFDPQRPTSTETLTRMTDVIRHRGPDDGGVWVDGPIGLGNRRLAVIDLSPRAHQPMSHAGGRFWIAYNGEIYNFQELRRELERDGAVFRSDSDTEVILQLYERRGVRCLDDLRGMFAFALWDGPRRRLLLARDRLGKKPVFYHYDDARRRLVFGSEPKALHEDPDVPRDPDPAAIHHYLTYGYVPSPWSAFKGLKKLPPAHYLLADESGIRIQRYWDLHYQPKRTEAEPELADELLTLLQDAVRLRMISDVPLGALLSGGIDSSAVVAVMRRLSSGPVRTFSIGFEQPEYDELAHARAVAERFETDHHETVVRPDIVAMLPRLVWHYNEPFADSSAVPSFAVCEMARRHVTVALNGDGGDESFLGYERYVATVVAGRQDRVPIGLRRAMTRAARLLPLGTPKSTVYRVRRFTETIAMDPRRRYLSWMAFFDHAAKTELYTPEFAAAAGGSDSGALLDAAYGASDAPAFLEATAHADVQMYLPDDLLVKMDIASMAHSLEVRSPFLDHKVVEFAASLPPHLKLWGLTKKYLLKRIMRGTLPNAIIDRPKMGFGVPLESWFRHELRDVVHETLLDDRATRRGYFRPEVVRRYLDEHMAGTAHHHFRLWNLLMLELWHRTFVDAGRTEPASVAG